jgi:Phosphotransferase enzyme family
MLRAQYRKAGRLYDRAALQPDLELVTAALGARPRSLEPLSQGGYTRSLAWRVETSDGPAFVKQAEDEGSLHMLRREALVYEHVRGSFLAEYFGFADAGGRAVLAIELFEKAYWPPPYPADAAPLFHALEEVGAAAPPAGLPSWKHRPSRWERIAADVSPLIGLGLCSEAWLEEALPTLIAAERGVVDVGDDLVHNDVYSGNVAFVGHRAVLVDWGAAVKGSRWVDVAFAVLSVRVEGGKLPPVDLPNEGAHAASLAGHFALEAPMPLPEWTPADSTLREDMIGDLAHALRWAAEVLELPLP